MKKDFPYDLINREFYSLESTSDFIQLLNEIKKGFFSNSFEKNIEPTEEDIEQTEDLKPITINRLKFYLSNLKKDNDETLNNLYQISEIPKKTGGYRKIHSPNADLKIVLKCIDVLLRSVYIPHPNAFAFIENKSIVDNAKMHTNKGYVYNVDLKDFFYSFDYNRIKTALYKEPFNLNSTKEKEEIAYWISILTTCKINGSQVLPQGSPASPVLTNIICKRLDDKLNRLAKEFSLNYSRYADDITFSSNQHVFHGKFISKLNWLIQSEGLVINESKIRLQNQGERQVVTGITVNKGTNVSRVYIKELRMYLYYIEQYGLKKALSYFVNDRKKNLQFTNVSLDKMNETYFQNTLKGKLNFLAMVRGKDDPLYSKLANRYNDLFQNSMTSFMEKIATICKIGNINIARSIYDEKIKDRKYKITSSFSLNEADIFDFIELSDSDLDNTINENLAIINRLNYKQGNEKKQLSELQLNINFLRQILAEKNISPLERHHIFEAFSEYMNSYKVDADKSEEKGLAIHDPKAVQNFLIKFTLQNSPVKFLTHPIDIPFNSFAGLMAQVNETIHYKYWSNLQKFDNELYWNVIHPFIFKKPAKKGKVEGDFSWGTYGIRMGWQYPIDLKLWCEANFDNQTESSKKMPGQMKIPKEYIPRDNANKPINHNGKSIKHFDDFITLFNNEIRFNDNELKVLLHILSKEILPQHDVDLDKVPEILPKFYVNVSKVRKVLKYIFKMINDRPSHRNVEISARIMKANIELKISHLHSVPSKFSDLKNGATKGSIATIVEELKHVCNFSIITGYNDSTEVERFDYLYDKMKNSKTRVTPVKVNNGFTFILTFLLPGNE